jgi:hypothetical protein
VPGFLEKRKCQYARCWKVMLWARNLTFHIDYFGLTSHIN